MKKAIRKHREFDFEDQVVLITGATGGIGLTLAQAFASAGARLSLVGRRAGLAKFFKSKLAARTATLALEADLSRIEDIERVVALTCREYGRIDVLINCAGTNIRKKLQDYTPADWDLIHAVNLKAVFFLSQQVARAMAAARRGKIINIGSIQGSICWTGNGRFSLAPYCASKAALVSLTKSFALDLARYHINVNAICPSMVDGRWVAPLKQDKELYGDILMRTPLKRLCRHEDLIGPVFLMASDLGSFITGQCLLVDGGWTIE